MFTLFHGNRQELLARLLAERLKAAPAGLFEAEAVVVQSGPMARWLQLFLAEELGIAAQLRFPFPAGYLWELFAAVLDDVPRSSPFAAGPLHWRLLRLLGQPREEALFAPLRHYLTAHGSQCSTSTHETRGRQEGPPPPDLPLSGGGDRISSLRSDVCPAVSMGDFTLNRRDSLALRLGAVFEDYLAYRPDWLAAWSEGRLLGLGPHEAWQAALWRELRAGIAGLPAAHPRDAFLAVLAREPRLAERLPRRIGLFGLGNLPPPYFEVFRELGRYLDVSLYLLNPCRLHWGDVVARRVAARHAAQSIGSVGGFADPADAGMADSLAVGNPLLGSLGTLSRQFFDMAAAGADAEIDVFVEPGREDLLARLQADLLDLVERGGSTAAAPPVALAANDDGDTLQIHVCHGPMREVEVLHDRLLALFEADPGLRPGDVLVLTPDIDAYAPLVEAVFAPVAGAALPAIPFTVADRPPAARAALPRAFAALLDLASGRLEAEEVLAFLEQPPVARRLGFDSRRLERARDWVRAAAIRWGVDGAWRAAQGAAEGGMLPAREEHGWRAGLERLLLGMAMPGEAESGLFLGRLPAAEIEGGAAGDLGRLIDFAESLFAAHAALNQARPVAAWAEVLAGLLERLFDSGEDVADQRAAQALRAALQRVAADAAQAGCVDAVPLACLRQALEAAQAEAAPGWTFLGGGVTFAALRPYRAVPVRVLCLLGMNDGAFPRNPARPGFDLVARHPRPGDRAPREEDRHAFLEALLSARDRLHISYVGRSSRDNSELPPSPLVSELLDVLARGYRRESAAGGAPDGHAVAASVIVEHPLQPFSRRYFDGSGPASYQADYAAASRAAAGRGGGGARQARPFLAEPLPVVDDGANDDADKDALDLEALIRFLQNPARHLLRQRLGIHLEQSEGLIENAEPFVLDPLARYGLDARIVEGRCAGESAETVMARAHARGELPHGAVGQAAFRRRWQALAPFVESLARELAAESATEPAAAGIPSGEPARFEPVAIVLDLSLAGLRLGGQLSIPGPAGLLDWRPGKTRAKDLLALWVRHLALNLAAPAGIRPVSRLLCLDASHRLGPVADAGACLTALLALWRRGQRELLPFFPATALDCVRQKGGWRNTWDSDFAGARPEKDDPYFDLAFAGTDPLGEEFEALARQVFVPLLAALEEA
ncbi:exodeoxyribonuclease V subunit gamma [Denitratisoma sp. DHT3]|uniref:exodeoxyribonuclease V subunit gamma n=1 Tax=Denitratisoma sp. DHT3 TaxID=1981880 RepID=UPI001645966A|nr:exodeoxyribonuclease V subunit gamma [Denitratisoma sp. DHT3]